MVSAEDSPTQEANIELMPETIICAHRGHDETVDRTTDGSGQVSEM